MRALLIRCYPAAWRERYGDEFASILEERPLGPFDVADILLGALDARLRMRDRRAGVTQRKGFNMSLRIGGIAAILGATALAIAWFLGSGLFAVNGPVAGFLLVRRPRPPARRACRPHLRSRRESTRPCRGRRSPSWRSGPSSRSSGSSGSPRKRRVLGARHPRLARWPRGHGPVRDRDLSDRGAIACARLSCSRPERSCRSSRWSRARPSSSLPPSSASCSVGSCSASRRSASTGPPRTPAQPEPSQPCA